jgi:hypothetical protein
MASVLPIHRRKSPSRRQLNVTDDSGTEARVNFRQRKASGALLEPVSGVGEEAYWLPQSGFLHGLWGSTRIFIVGRRQQRPDGK